MWYLTLLIFVIKCIVCVFLPTLQSTKTVLLTAKIYIPEKKQQNIQALSFFFFCIIRMPKNSEIYFFTKGRWRDKMGASEIYSFFVKDTSLIIIVYVAGRLHFFTKLNNCSPLTNLSKIRAV